tara:strand:+ start:430 stop:693 length:264 start_codon:yes stop_codon:yes gene_type:complete
MKWVLVNKADEIVSKCEIASSVGISGAKTYFMGIKQMEEKEFDKLWKVMSEQHYDTQRDLANRQGKQYEWWKDEWTNPDIDVVEDGK